jgi:hypothetical protein
MTDEPPEEPCDHNWGRWTSERHCLNGVWVAWLEQKCYNCGAKRTSDTGVVDADEENEWG